MAKSSYSSIDSKGQITIPFPIRSELHLSAGSKVEFLHKDGWIVMRPITSLKGLKGLLPKPKRSLSREELNEIIRSHR